MCGRFDTSSLTWAQIYSQLSNWGPVRTATLNLEPNDDVRPTTQQLTGCCQANAKRSPAKSA